MHTERTAAFRSGLTRTVPLMVGAAPFGLVFGALGVGAGLSPAATMGMSLFVFAGSSQFVAAGLVSRGVAIGVIVATTLVINIRHLLFATALIRHLRHVRLPMRALLAFFLTDETYVIAAGGAPTLAPALRVPFQLGSAAGMYLNWQLWTGLGIVAGSQLAGLSELGLEIAMGVTFVGMVVPMVRTVPMAFTALTAGTTAVLVAEAIPNLGILVATLVGIVAGAAVQLAGGYPDESDD